MRHQKDQSRQQNQAGKNILILFATREGQTRKIAYRIAEHLEHSGQTTEIVDAADTKITALLDLERYDLLVFGASMHAGGLEPEMIRLINSHADQIGLKPRSFFLVLLSAATKEPALRETSLTDARRKLDSQLNLKFDSIEFFAGALTYSKYSKPVKWLMRRIAKKSGGGTDTSRDYEYTDWEHVRRYAQHLLKE